MAKVPVFHEDTYYEIPLTEEELKTHKGIFLNSQNYIYIYIYI